MERGQFPEATDGLNKLIEEVESGSSRNIKALYILGKV